MPSVIFSMAEGYQLSVGGCQVIWRDTFITSGGIPSVRIWGIQNKAEGYLVGPYHCWVRYPVGPQHVSVMTRGRGLD